jgi:hypothetical protein
MSTWKLPNWNQLKRVIQGVAEIRLPRRVALYSLPEVNGSDFCSGGKMSYPDKKAALSELNALHKTGRKKTERLRAYYCSQCSAWHLTKQMPWYLSS